MDDPGTGGPVDFTVAGLQVHLVSGGWVAGPGVLTLYLTDQLDTCLAIAAVPVGTATTFSLRVVTPPGGATTAAIVPGATPAVGEATGGLVRATGGVASASVAAEDGAVTWQVNPSGNLTLVSLDVGFAGTADRMITGGLLLRRCGP